VYAEVALREEQRHEAESFAIHPALLDSALHAIGFAMEIGEPLLPFSWSDVSLPAGTATELRVRLACDGRELSLDLADSAGSAVAAIGSLALRPLDPAKLDPAGRARDELLEVEWREAERDGWPAAERAPGEPATSSRRPSDKSRIAWPTGRRDAWQSSRGAPSRRARTRVRTLR
jgi:hypothetical protein